MATIKVTKTTQIKYGSLQSDDSPTTWLFCVFLSLFTVFLIELIDPYIISIIYIYTPPAPFADPVFRRVWGLLLASACNSLWMSLAPFFRWFFFGRISAVFGQNFGQNFGGFRAEFRAEFRRFFRRPIFFGRNENPKRRWIPPGSGVIKKGV
jgi:hypothetical protein